MSSKENDHIEDAELRALLHTLPQAGPSAELDAAILTAADKALYIEAALDADTDPRVGKSRVFHALAVEREAANDAAIPQAAPPARPGFLSRWKVPLAFAASVLVAVNMIGPQWFTSSPQEFPATVAPMPAAAPPASAPVPPQAEPAKVAASPVPVPAPAAGSAARAPLARQRAAPEPSPVAAPVIDSVREQPMAATRPEMEPAPAPMAQARQAPAGKMAFSMTAPAPVAARSEASGDAPKNPQAWLLEIERMLKADRSKDAVDEWEKFRRAYPDYPAPQELTERLQALKK
ncbi:MULTISPECIES: hypothetical protein [unclassified Janthinobacterium]|uniref:hypothetical protein n=1 Tax=unclassified Janthinobacterium TaxID=2610881 RepID=UPI00034B6AD1|nr:MULTISPECIES: hypothetical protein [unclassified Janthinobacterium]MEC5161612.1 hypothetical protein [Janthinobacterium sp. CG_S6]